MAIVSNNTESYQNKVFKLVQLLVFETVIHMRKFWIKKKKFKIVYSAVAIKHNEKGCDSINERPKGHIAYLVLGHF